MSPIQKKNTCKTPLGRLRTYHRLTGATYQSELVKGITSYDGLVQTRNVDRTPRPLPLSLKYGWTWPLRAASFDKYYKLKDVIHDSRDFKTMPTSVRALRQNAEDYEFLLCENFDNSNTSFAFVAAHPWAYTDFPATALTQPSATTAFTAAERNLANTMALSRVTLTGWESQVDLAELPETMLLLRNPLQSLGKILNRFDRHVKVTYDLGVKKSSAFYRGKNVRKREYVEAAMSTYLAGRYGFTPAILSACDIAETFAGKYSELFKVFTAKGAYKQKYTYTYSSGRDLCFTIKYWGGEFRPTLYCTGYVEGERKTSYVIRYIPNWMNPDVVQLARWGISPTQIPVALYEATPFSFMLDWVTNLGMWIKAVMPKPELMILDACRTETWKNILHLSSQRGGVLYNQSGVATGACRIARDVMERVVITNTMTAPIPSFRGGGMNLLRSMDAVSIAALILKPKVEKWAKLLPGFIYPSKGV